MTLNLTIPQQTHTDFTPRITVIGVGGGGTNAVDNMIALNCRAWSSSSPTPTRSN